MKMSPSPLRPSQRFHEQSRQAISAKEYYRANKIEPNPSPAIGRQPRLQSQQNKVGSSMFVMGNKCFEGTESEASWVNRRCWTRQAALEPQRRQSQPM